jgi:ubiquinone/menaquinone biosynthesis C-methylase UbiE
MHEGPEDRNCCPRRDGVRRSRNFSEPHKALEGMYRVLRPGGTALVLDLHKDVPMSEIKKYFRTISWARSTAGRPRRISEFQDLWIGDF